MAVTAKSKIMNNSDHRINLIDSLIVLISCFFWKDTLFKKNSQVSLLFENKVIQYLGMGYISQVLASMQFVRQISMYLKSIKTLKCALFQI